MTGKKDKGYTPCPKCADGVIVWGACSDCDYGHTTEND